MFRCSSRFLPRAICSSAAAAAVLLASTAALAQTAPTQAAKRFGRLPDGRAYRVDHQGYQLVDHIAELEVTNDDLRRQVIALENELEQKQRAVDSLKSGGKAGGTAVKEASLLPPAASRAAASKNEPPDCNELVSGLYMRVSQLESKLQEKSVPAAQLALRCPPAAGGDDELREQITRLQTALMDAPSKEALLDEKERSRRLAVEVSALQAELAAADASRGALQAKDEKIAALEAEIARRIDEKDEQLRNLELKLAARADGINGERAADQTTGRAKLSAKSGVTVINRGTADENTQLEVDRGRKEFRKTLAEIQSKIMTRKDRLDSLKKSSKGISISVSNLTTSRGQSLDALRGEVKRLGKASDLDAIREGLAEIQSKLDDDLATLKRLTR